MRIKSDTNLYEILDDYTGEWVTYVKTTTGYDGTTIVESNESTYIDSIIYIKIASPHGDGYARRVLPNGHINVKWFGLAGDGVTDDYVKFKDVVNLSVLVGAPIVIKAGTDIYLGTNILRFPENAKIIFDGGTITSGTLIGAKTTIRTDNSQIFTTNVVLEGTFNMDYICPQHFGAITNDDITTFSNDISVIFQKCIDSPIPTYFPPGYYYQSLPVYITKPVNISLSGTNHPDTRSHENGIVQDHARIYTDQNSIHLINIQSGGVDILGGVFDVTQPSAFIGSVIRYDLNYPMWGGNIDVRIKGDFDKVKGLGIGGYGIYFDQTGLVSEDGYAVFIYIKGYIEFMHTGIMSDALPVPSMGTFVNSLDIDVNMDGCKMFYDLKCCDISRIRGICQNREEVLHVSEDYYAFQLEGSVNKVDVYLWDTNERWNGKTYNILGKHNYSGHFTEYNVKNTHNLHNIVTPHINNPPRSIISKDKSSIRDTVISKLDSETGAFDKRHTVTMKAYKGTGIDFDVDLDEMAIAETTDITLANIDKLFTYTGVSPTVVFTALADLDIDFVEIVLTPSTGTFDWNALFLFLKNGSNAFKRIQLIERYSDLTVGTYDIYPEGLDTRLTKKAYSFYLESKSSTKTIIRLIGAEVITEVIEIMDLCLTRAIPSVLPYIHIDGGQRIWGNLTTEQYRIAALNTAPASAAATGTLGEIRITADHIYICTATNTWKRVAISTW